MQNAMPKYYLRAVGEGLKTSRSGTRLAGRYELKSDQIVLDTQPQNPPDTPEEIPEEMVPYLKLFPYRLHIPQVYGIVAHSALKQNADVWLLEGVPITSDGENFLPELTSEWPKASIHRQLNWLWQMAQLWQPMSRQGVASSLLDGKLLRVEGPIVRLLELKLDSKTPNLRQLGELWRTWIPEAKSNITNFLQQLCGQMIDGSIRNAEQVLHQLDEALTIVGSSLDRTISIATATETGPTRSHNEDACYPQAGTIATKQPGVEALAIVCDGIGGQDAGEVASTETINVLYQRIQQMQLNGNIEPNALLAKLERSACAANDHVCGRNDSENRQGRQRMGTTLVMALANGHEVYVTHIGDSRAYWITRYGCHQITIDDDVASREVRLGYYIYRDALQQAAAGALVQALGITSSATLHPTTQRFPIDEDCVFLLCSDGLSDRDRVDEYWQGEILPLLQGKADVTIATVRDRLVQIANTKNGHDNVTIGIIHYQVTDKNTLPAEISVPLIEGFGSDPIDEDYDPGAETQPLFSDSDKEFGGRTRILPSEKGVWGIILGLIFVLGLCLPLIYFLYGALNKPPELIDGSPSPSSQPSSEVSPNQVKPRNSQSPKPKDNNKSGRSTPNNQTENLDDPTKDQKTRSPSPNGTPNELNR